MLSPSEVRIDVAVAQRFLHDCRRSGEAAWLLANLSEEAQTDLTALAWLGIGLYQAAEWPEARFEAGVVRADTPCYLLRLSHLPETIEAGLAKIAANRLH